MGILSKESPHHCHVHVPLKPEETCEEFARFLGSPWACGSECDFALVRVLSQEPGHIPVWTLLCF